MNSNMGHLRRYLTVVFLCGALVLAGCNIPFTDQETRRAPLTVTPAEVPSDHPPTERIRGSPTEHASTSITNTSTRVPAAPLSRNGERMSFTLHPSGNSPATIIRGEPVRLRITYQHSTPQRVTRTFVIQRQGVTDAGVEPTVTDRRTLARVTARSGPNESVRITRNLTISTIGDDLRLAVLVYHDELPASDTTETANAVSSHPITVVTANNTTTARRQP